MNRTIRSRVAAAAATAALSLIPLAAVAGPASAATAAPGPCATPMTFTGMDASYTEHLFYRAGCSSPAVPLDSVVPYGGSGGVLMPDGRHVVSVGIPSSQDPGTSSTSAVLAVTDIATDTTTPVAQSGPTAATSYKNDLSVAPDGSAVAFEVGNAEPAYDGIFVQPLNGSPSYRVSPVATLGGYPAPAGHTTWSHDGKYIAYAVRSSGGPTIAWARSDGSGQAGQITIPGVVVYDSPLAWTPDDKGLLTWDNSDAFASPPTGHLLYIDLATGTVTTLLTAEPGRVFTSVSVDQHWDVFLTSTDQDNPGVHTGPRMEAAWLGDPGKITILPNAYTDSSGGNIPAYWSADPSVSTAGPADPRPAALPGGTPAPTPTPTPTPTPAPTKQVILFELRGTRGSATENSPTDGVTRTFTAAVTGRLPKGDVLAVPVQYPAVPMAGSIRIATDFVNGGYVASEQKGIANLRAAIRQYQAQYPKDRLAFVGYSSGAQVVRTVIAGMSAAEQNKVAFVVTYGDPLFLSRQSFDRGHWVSGLTGIYWAARALKPKLPDPGFTRSSIRGGYAGMTKALASRTEDWCVFGDPIANYPSAAIWQHFAYAPHDKPGPFITQGAAFAAGMVR